MSMPKRFVRGKNRDPASGSRLAVLADLLDELAAHPKGLGSSDFNALAMMIADAALDADEASLTAAQEGLQRLYGLQSWIDQPSPEQLEARGRVLGMIDLLQWTLRRVVTAAGPRAVDIAEAAR